eukprot:9269278-Lingulodinium_polyedra.AAC.1
MPNLALPTSTGEPSSSAKDAVCKRPAGQAALEPRYSIMVYRKANKVAVRMHMSIGAKQLFQFGKPTWSEDTLRKYANEAVEQLYVGKAIYDVKK